MPKLACVFLSNPASYFAMALRIRYNAPVILTISLACMVVYFVNWLFWGDADRNPGGLIHGFFVLSGYWSWSDLLNYIRLFSYPLGHANLGHLVGNMSMFLLLGPILEEKYGSRNLLKMMAVTTLLTAVVNIILFDTGLYGASGLVFMFIVLVSFADMKQGTIPLTFILVALFYLGQEVLQSVQSGDQISQYAHIAGGIIGAIFGFSAIKPQGAGERA